MKAFQHISAISVFLLATGVAFAQGHGRRREMQRPAPPPAQQQQQRSNQPSLQRGESGNQPNQQQGQRPFDRFILHGPGPHSGDWLRDHEDLSPEQQRKALESDPGFQKLPPQRQEKLRERFNDLLSRPPDQRRRILQRMETWEHLSPGQQNKARTMFQDFRDLPKDRRKEMNRAFRDLENMSPEERQKTIDSDAYRTHYSDRERELLRGMSELGLTTNGNPREP